MRTTRETHEKIAENEGSQFQHEKMGGDENHCEGAPAPDAMVAAEAT